MMNWKPAFKKKWCEEHEELVLSELNYHRDYCVSELRNVMVGVFKDGKEANYPNKDEMTKIILRDKKYFEENKE